MASSDSAHRRYENAAEMMRLRDIAIKVREREEREGERERVRVCLCV